jgi:uncharacterized protein
MLVISDTSPIINLAAIGYLHLLPDLFGEIVIPKAVFQEIVIDGAGESGADEIQSATWIRVVKSKNRVLLKKISNSLDAGESEAIVIDIELKADYLLMDERLGRQIANDYGIKLLGVLGILLRAKNVQLIQSVSELMDKLRDEAGFFIHQNLYKQVKELAGE